MRVLSISCRRDGVVTVTMEPDVAVGKDWEDLWMLNCFYEVHCPAKGKAYDEDEATPSYTRR